MPSERPLFMADTYFFAVLAIAITEMVLSGFWNHSYFTIGIPVFRQRVPLRLNEVPTPDQLALAMKSRWTAPLIFHKFQNGEVGFRERAFGGGFYFHYTPIMHGIIRQDSSEPCVMIVGLLNWFIPAFVILAVGTFGDHGLVFGVFVAAVVGLLYLLQRRRFLKVAAAVSSKTAG